MTAERAVASSGVTSAVEGADPADPSATTWAVMGTGCTTAEAIGGLAWGTGGGGGRCELGCAVRGFDLPSSPQSIGDDRGCGASATFAVGWGAMPKAAA